MFKVGDRVSWNSEAGRVRGKIVKVHRQKHRTFPFFTIGHSTRPIDEFIDLLAGSQIGLVVDVRTVPRSRTKSQCESQVASPIRYRIFRSLMNISADLAASGHERTIVRPRRQRLLEK